MSMADQWWVLDMDEGVISGPHATKKAAMEYYKVYPYFKVHRYGSGSYEMFFGFDSEDRDSYFVETTSQATRNGFDWALHESKLKEDCPDE